MLSMVLFIVLISCFYSSSLISGQTISCPKGYALNATSCYAFHHVELTWPEAVTFCNALGSHLVRVETQAEHDFLKQKAKELVKLGTYPLHSFWVGSSDAMTQGEWIWADTKEHLMTPIPWARGQPQNRAGEDCMGLYYEGGYDFGDWFCRHLLHPLCEKRATVDGSQIIG